LTLDNYWKFLKHFSASKNNKQLSVEIGFTTKRFKKCFLMENLQKEFMQILIKYLDLIKTNLKEFKLLDIITIMTLMQANNEDYFK